MKTFIFDPFRWWGCYLVAFLFFAPGAAADEEAHELKDLVVTAGLEPVSIRDVASSVTVITREEIDQRQVKYLADLLRSVPGFSGLIRSHQR